MLTWHVQEKIYDMMKKSKLDSRSLTDYNPLTCWFFSINKLPRCTLQETLSRNHDYYTPKEFISVSLELHSRAPTCKPLVKQTNSCSQRARETISSVTDPGSLKLANKFPRDATALITDPVPRITWPLPPLVNYPSFNSTNEINL